MQSAGPALAGLLTVCLILVVPTRVCVYMKQQDVVGKKWGLIPVRLLPFSFNDVFILTMY